MAETGQKSNGEDKWWRDVVLGLILGVAVGFEFGYFIFRQGSERVEALKKMEKNELNRADMLEDVLDTISLDKQDSIRAQECMILAKSSLTSAKNNIEGTHESNDSYLFRDSVMVKNAQKHMDSLEKILYKRMKTGAKPMQNKNMPMKTLNLK